MSRQDRPVNENVIASPVIAVLFSLISSSRNFNPIQSSSIPFPH
jgi:hypothetical protein